MVDAQIFRLRRNSVDSFPYLSFGCLNNKMQNCSRGLKRREGKAKEKIIYKSSGAHGLLKFIKHSRLGSSVSLNLSLSHFETMQI